MNPNRIGRRRARWWPAFLFSALIALAPVPALEAAPAGAPSPAMARLAWPGYRFTLAYTHSLFHVPVREQFAVDWQGRLVLREIWSTDPRVVGYYDIPDARVVEAPAHVLITDLSLPHKRLTVRGTPVGGRSFADGRCSVALAAVAGDWGALDLSVRLRPLALRIINLGVFQCPPDRTQKMRN